MNEFLKKDPIAEGPFTPSWESLRSYTCPDWFRDAKFGIWSHWGPQVVPGQGDWYARHLYVQGHPQYYHHLRTYGHPSVHGHKDLIAAWKAERFDPESLMKRFVDAGARYFVAQANHHDNFDNWNSKHHRWNSVQMGPKKDIVGLWKAAAKKHGLPFGLTEHLSATYTWWVTNKFIDPEGPWAGVKPESYDPALQDLYLPHTQAEIDEAWRLHQKGERLPWYTANPYWHEVWFKRIKDLIDQHEPELLYTDGALPFDEVGRHIVAHLYNVLHKRHGAHLGVYNQKDKSPDVARIGVFDIEKGQAETAETTPWQTDTCIANWFYDVRAPFKTPKQIAETLVDIVAKNGNLLLNVIQLPDGSLNEEASHLLDRLAAWMKVNGEGLHGTRPWSAAAEGPSRFVQKARFEEKPVEWTSSDFRFTARGPAVYAFQMKYPDDRMAYVRRLGKQAGPVKAVSVLGAQAPVRWRQEEDCLVVHLPAQKVCEFLPCLKIEMG
ncbi:MAG: alpha-L-fucosidase [Spirochaetes bacterium]|nr:alpha-L-fucosidase [Spirochaetota bacterium]